MKQRYCSLCGSPKDPKTKICSGCGRRPFFRRINKTSVVLFSLLLLCLFSSAFLFSRQEQKVRFLESENAYLLDLAEEGLEIIQARRADIDDLKEELNSTRKELTFFRNHAAIVTPTGNKYHHYSCHHWNNESFYVFNLEYAEARGNSPCADCWAQGLISERLTIEQVLNAGNDGRKEEIQYKKTVNTLNGTQKTRIPTK